MRNIKLMVFFQSIQNQSKLDHENKEYKSNHHSSAISIFQTSPARSELLRIGIIH